MEQQISQLLDENAAYKSQLDVYDQAYQKVMTLRKPKQKKSLFCTGIFIYDFLTSLIYDID